MEIKDAASALENFFLEYSDDLNSHERVRTLDVIEKEKRLHHGPSGKRSRRNPLGLDRWSRNHARDVKHIRSVPYMPGVLSDQVFNKPARQITRASIYLPESAYLKGFKKFYELSIGSKELAENIIDGYDNTPAQDGSGGSITDWAVDCLDEGLSFGLNSGHLDNLTDVADMEAGLSLAVAARKGRKYVSNFKLLINKNMTRESYKFIPLPWLLSIGLVPYWGLPPGKSASENGITDDLLVEINKLVIDQYWSDRKIGAVALGFVLGGTRVIKVADPATGKIQKLMMPEPYAGSFASRCEGGLVIANRVKDNVEISSVVNVSDNGRRKNRGQLIDELHRIHAEQASRLTGHPAGYIALSGDTEGKEILVAA
jgi:hypothetical protein